MSDTIASASAPQVDSTDHAADSQRAAIARVTLQLRQTIAAAEGVERQIALARQTACDELRTRLDALQEQRRQMLELEVQRREADAAATVAPAHRQVAPSVDAPATTSLVPVQPLISPLFGAWTEIEVLEGEGGALSQMRVIMRVVNGDLEAELLQMH